MKLGTSCNINLEIDNYTGGKNTLIKHIRSLGQVRQPEINVSPEVIHYKIILCHPWNSLYTGESLFQTFDVQLRSVHSFNTDMSGDTVMTHTNIRAGHSTTKLPHPLSVCWTLGNRVDFHLIFLSSSIFLLIKTR